MSDAARTSSTFPGVGAMSVVASGWVSDRIVVNGRWLVLFLGMRATAAALSLQMSMPLSAAGMTRVRACFRSITHPIGVNRNFRFTENWSPQ
ncbi:MAG TPA: hypothetical protein VGD63_09375, partial [Steroidobacteraceae bacterium]